MSLVTATGNQVESEMHDLLWPNYSKPCWFLNNATKTHDNNFITAFMAPQTQQQHLGSSNSIHKHSISSNFNMENEDSRKQHPNSPNVTYAQTPNISISLYSTKNSTIYPEFIQFSSQAVITLPYQHTHQNSMRTVHNPTQIAHAMAEMYQEQ